MTHDERMALAQEIAGRLLAKHGDGILGIAVYGSTGKGEDAEHSDLEMWVATDGDVPKEQHWIVYRGTVIDLDVGPGTEILEAAQRVKSDWAIDADGYRHYIVLHERDGFFGKLRSACESADDEDFDKAIAQRMAMTFETYGKLRNAWDRGDRYCILLMARHIAYETAYVLGLVNRRYYKSDRDLVQMSKELPVPIPGYRELVDVAGNFTSCDPAEVYAAARDLWGRLEDFVAERGIEWTTEELPV